MKRTISHEASVAAARLRELGFAPCGPSIASSGGALDPLAVLGLGPAATWPEVRHAYVGRLRMYHPEHQPQEFMRVVDAYDTLKRFLRANAANASAGEGAGDDCSALPAQKRRRADAGGYCQPASDAASPIFAGLQECLPAVATASPVIALDPTGVGHIGHRDRLSQGSPLAPAGQGAVFSPANVTVSPLPFAPGFGPSCGFAGGGAFGDGEGGGLSRAVSNHMGGGGCGGPMGSPLGAYAGGQSIGGVCGGATSLGIFSNRGDSGMMIG